MERWRLKKERKREVVPTPSIADFAGQEAADNAEEAQNRRYSGKVTVRLLLW